MKNLDGKRARWIRVRMGVLCAVMGVSLGVIVSSAYRVQVEDGAAWRELAEKQRQRRLHVEPKRGSVYDRSGQPLAVSVEVPSVVADVAEMLHGVDGEGAQTVVLRDAAVRIGAALSMNSNEIYEKLATKRRFIWLKRRASADESQAIRDLGDQKKQVKPLKGLSIEGEGHRYYPGRELLGPVLGFVAPDGQGKDGLELALDEELRGRVEEVKGLRDRGGHLLFEGGQVDEQALAGHDVTLTIDSAIQHLLQQELDAAMGTYETKGGAAVVMDPQTGEILAMASTPGYNPNDYSEADPDSRRDRAVTDRFEPGSVMKVFTMAAALTQGVIKPTETINCEHGTYQVGNVVIHDTHLNDWLTPTQILAKSSNIGALKIGLRLGEPGLYAALRRFGFGEQTGLPLPGEAGGVLRPKGRPWFDVETANASFGQGVSVTTLQLATAMSAIANGGKLLEPILVKRVTTSTGDVVREGTMHVRREAAPAHVTKLLAEMLTAVTEEGGTGVEASVPGFRVAGKTATAQKVDPATGKYSQEKFTASFVGFVPAERPRVVVAVVLDEPMIGHYGGDLAGPVFRRVAEASLRYLGVTPNDNAKAMAVSRNDDPADKVLAAYRQLPAQATADPAPSVASTDGIAVPDTTGMGARDAIRAMLGAGLVPQLEGSGHSVKQSPAAGTLVPKGSSVRVSFEQSS
jgi:cell division protein FtsI (penicillin-binding protein 3)